MVALIVKRRRYSVVLVTYGEVEKLSVRSLWPSSRKIVQVLTRQIVRLPKLLIYMLADFRSARHYIDWKLHRYRSRLVEINRNQARLVDAEFRKHPELAGEGSEVEVLDACYFVPPVLEEVLASVRKQADGVVIVPMIPVESAFSCGPACQFAIDIFGEGHLASLRVVRGLWKDEALHRLYLDHLFNALPDAWKSRKPTGKQGLVLVIHGTIVKNRRGEKPSVFTGLDETMEFYRLMREKILDDPRNVFDEVKLGCLNHSRGGEWTHETIEKALNEFRQEGVASVAMFPFGYFADNSETDYEAMNMLARSGAARKQYIPCVNDSPAFAQWLSVTIAREIGVLDVQQRAFGTHAAAD